MKQSKTVQKWLGRLSPGTAEVNWSMFQSFIRFLKESGGSLADFSPDDLVEYQKNCDNGNMYDVLDVVQNWILSLDNHRASYKKRSYATVKSFFLHNRALLPSDPSFKISGDKPKVRGRLTVDIIRNVILASNRTYQAIFLSMFQGGMGSGEFVEWNETGLQGLLAQLRDDVNIVKIELSGRKHSRYKRNFYTFIGLDAIEAVRQYLEKVTRRDGAIFINQLGDPVSKNAVKKYWSSKIYKLGYASRTTEPNYQGHRTGMNIHELRDVFRSQWEKSPAKSSVCEYLMGHQVDPLEYNKAFRDERWTCSEYKKALPMLQIMSSSRPFGQVDEGIVETQQQRIEDLESELVKLRTGRNSEVETLRTEMERMRVEHKEDREILRMLYKKLKEES
jgi:integrase